MPNHSKLKYDWNQESAQSVGWKYAAKSAKIERFWNSVPKKYSKQYIGLYALEIANYMYIAFLQNNILWQIAKKKFYSTIKILLSWRYINEFLTTYEKATALQWLQQFRYFADQIV